MLNHKGTKTLKSDRVVLKSFRNSDYKSVYENWSSDPNVTRFLTWSYHKSLEEAKSMVDFWTFMSNQTNYYNWNITLIGLDSSIGGIGVSSINEDDDSCEIGYCLSQKYWNQGITTEVLKMCINYLFNEIGFSRIEGIRDIRNEASGKVMEKCSMRLKEILLDYRVLGDGTLTNVEKYVILKDSRE